MGFDVNESLKKLTANLVTLKITTKITDDLLDLPKWLFLRQQYLKTKQPIGKAVVSIWNAIITQEKRVFILTRDATRNLIKGDKNWEDNPGLSNDNWKAILKLAMDGLIKCIIEGEGNQPSVYELIEENTLKYTAGTSNREEQLQQAIDYIKQKYPNYKFIEPSDNKPDNKPDTVVSREKEEVSSKKFSSRDLASRPIHEKITPPFDKEGLPTFSPKSVEKPVQIIDAQPAIKSNKPPTPPGFGADEEDLVARMFSRKNK